MRADQTLHHLAFAIPHDGHINAGRTRLQTVFKGLPGPMSNFSRMDEVLARKTSDIRARAANVPALNQCSLLSRTSQGPGKILTCLAAAQDQKVILVGCEISRHYAPNPSALDELEQVAIDLVGMNDRHPMRPPGVKL